MFRLVTIARAAMTSLAGAAVILTASNLLTEPALAAQGPAQPQLSFTCGFTSGPRAGQSQSYAGVAGIEAAPVGTFCADGQGSTGTVVPDAPVQAPPPVQPSPTAQAPATTFICRFDNGPRAGQIQSYAGVTGMRAIGIGAPCSDGQGSTGVAIAEQPVQPPVPVQPPPALPVPATTSVCRFDTGPRAGQSQSYAGVTGMQPLLVGSGCTDGQGSSGVAIPEVPVQPPAIVPPAAPPPVPALTSTCQFDAGPRAGHFQSYAGVTGIRPMRVGRRCTDGHGSTGVAIPDVPVEPPVAVQAPATAAVSTRTSARSVARGPRAITSAAVGASIPGVRGAVWADPKNSGYVTGYTQNGPYHPGAPPGYGPTTRTIAARANDGAAVGAVADGYVNVGRDDRAGAAEYGSSAAPPPPPPPPSAAPVVPPITRTGERG